MKLKIATLVGVLALVASSAFADGMQWVAIKAGASLPMSDLKDAAGTGYNIAGEYGYALGKNYALGADVAYHMFGKKDIDTGFGTVSIKPKITQYTAQGWWMFPMKDPKAYPYITVGAGGYSFDSGVSGTSSKTKFGANGGVGYNYGVNENMSVGLDAGYHWVSTDKAPAGSKQPSVGLVTVDVHVGWGFGAGAKK